MGFLTWAKRWRRRILTGALALALATGLGAAYLRAPIKVEIGLDPQQHFQTFRAWEATIELLWTEKFDAHRDEIYDRLFDEVGITRLRLEMFSGDENTTRSFERFLSHDIDMAGWRARRYATVNDDADPNHINWAGFDFADLDWRVEKVLLPLQDRARKRGQKLEVNLTYVAFTKQIVNGSYIHTDPEEYAEFVLAAFLHLQDKYHLVPDDFEVVLEPDNVREWTPELLGKAMAAVTRRLHAAGFHPRLIAPSLSDAALVPEWLDAIAKVAGATDALAEIDYHRYHGAKPEVLNAIADRARALGIESSMLEFWFGRADYKVLHNDLKLGNVSAWQGRTVLTFHDIDANDKVVLNADVRYNRLYFMAIRPGAVRIGAASTAPYAADPIAFQNPDGSIAVVIRADHAAKVTLTDLPQGDYLLQTASKGSGMPQPTAVHIGPDGRYLAEIPGPGVISLRPAPKAGG
jgi:hypothetical protein